FDKNKTYMHTPKEFIYKHGIIAKSKSNQYYIKTEIFPKIMSKKISQARKIREDSDYDDEHVKKQRLEKYDQLYNRKFQELKEEREAELDDIVSINRKNKNTVQDRRNQRNSQFLNNKNLKNNKLNKSSYYNDDDDDIEYRARKTYGSKYDA
ncbi:MAG: hypothetical protein IJ730_06660, partial [Alphaproteobacteria bacterium]|nr:hypothetical protein [Alphaproteobacteria bacterium]